MEGCFSNFKQNRRFPIKRKLEIIEYAKNNGTNAVTNFSEFSTKTIRKL